VGIKTIHTIRYRLVNKAGMPRHPAGRAVLRLSPNTTILSTFTRALECFAKAAQY
jgi:hypothetical protein